MARKRLGIIGAGKMGEMIIQGLMQGFGQGFRQESKQELSSLETKTNLDFPQYEIQATTRSPESAKEISSRLAIYCHTDNVKLAFASDILILCSKPHQAEAILRSIRPAMDAHKLLITICASVSTRQASLWSGEQSAIVRAMPNTPCLIGQGMTVLCGGGQSRNEDLKTAEAIFQALGKTATIEESLMDGATGLSGCGPAYVYLIIEALSEAGVKIGLPRKTATLMAAQTLAGAAQMTLQRNMHPAALKDEVTTPAGCTIDGLMALEEGKLRATLIKAVLAATERSRVRSGTESGRSSQH